MTWTGPASGVAPGPGEPDRVFQWSQGPRLDILEAMRVQRFDRITRITRMLFDVPVALITFAEGNLHVVASCAGTSMQAMAPPAVLCDETLLSVGPLIVPDAAEDTRFRFDPLVTGEAGVRFYAGYPLVAPDGSAIGALCVVDQRPREMRIREIDLLRELADWVESELAQTGELDRAGHLQHKMLPRRPPRVSGYDIAGRCISARRVGGDFYDWYDVHDGFQVVVADVMGSGITAAIIAASVRSLVRAASRFADVASAVNQVSYSLENDLTHTASFVTLFVARLDPTRHRLTYVDAGHGLVAIVHQDGSIEQIVSAGLPLGVLPAEVWTADELAMEPGETVVCCSNGLFEQFGSIAAMERFYREHGVARGGMHSLVDVLTSAYASQPPQDDVTIVGIHRRLEP